MNKDVINKINEIQSAAIAATVEGRAHVFVDYAGHIQNVHIRAYSTDTVYETRFERLNLMYSSVYIDNELGGSDEEIISNLDEVLNEIEAL